MPASRLHFPSRQGQHRTHFSIEELDAKFHIFGGSKKGSDDALLGQTVTSAYLDEGSTLDEGFLLEVERRLTFAESMLIVTSNGGAPSMRHERNYVE